VLGDRRSILAVYRLFPFWPETADPFDLASEEQFRMLFKVVTDYWPFALIAIVRDWRWQLQPLGSPGNLDIFRPLRRLGRTHIFIILAMTVAGVAGTGLVFYWFTLLFFYFPWNVKAIYKRIKARSD